MLNVITHLTLLENCRFYKVIRKHKFYFTYDSSKLVAMEEIGGKLLSVGLNTSVSKASVGPVTNYNVYLSVCLCECNSCLIS